MGNELIVAERNITDKVLNNIRGLEKQKAIFFPPNYIPENALKSEWLKLQTVVDLNKKKALDVCTPNSIANSLLDLVVQGLSTSKNQAYFIVYGKELQLSRSYMGTVAVTKRLKGVKDVFANVIYEGDEFKYITNLTNGLKEITIHDQDFQNINPQKIKGAYCIVVRDGEPNYVEIMNMEQIRTSWKQGKAKGDSPAHRKFPEEMAKKSVINRACKMFFNTSDDSDTLIDSINRTTEVEYETIADAEDVAQTQITENANSIDIEDAVVEEKKVEITVEAKVAEPSEAEKKEIEQKELGDSEDWMKDDK